MRPVRPSQSSWLGTRLNPVNGSNSACPRCWMKASGWSISCSRSLAASIDKRPRNNCARGAGRSAGRFHWTFSNRPLACQRAPSCSATLTAWWRSAWPARTRISRFNGSCMRCSACSSRASGVLPGTSSIRLADNGAPSRHCQPARASTATSRVRNRRGNKRSLGKVVLLRIAQRKVGAAVLHAQHGAVALGFQQFDAVDQRAAVDIDLLEHLLEQQRARGQRQLPLLGFALQLQVEVTLQAAAVALQHGEEQAVLLGPGALVRQRLPAVGVTPRNALGTDAVILLQRGFEQPQQAVVFGQDEGAFADQGLRQGAQVFFLDEAAVDHAGFGQLIAQLL